MERREEKERERERDNAGPLASSTARPPGQDPGFRRESVDIFRMKGGKISEHWDVQQNVEIEKAGREGCCLRFEIEDEGEIERGCCAFTTAPPPELPTCECCGEW